MTMRTSNPFFPELLERGACFDGIVGPAFGRRLRQQRRFKARMASQDSSR